ncbi:MAG: glycosyltransferase [Verrucomicrobia bacterium]|nr:glycosyltransferase [Verrucomicrobiota bacterium]
MKFVLFYHSLVSDWNHGNAHFLRGIAAELIKRGHQVNVYEPADGWSLTNLCAKHGEAPLKAFANAYPTLTTNFYRELNLKTVLDGADIVLVHEWTDPGVVAGIGQMRRQNRFALFFHDTHHRAVTAREQMEAYDLRFYDGVLAYGKVLTELYLKAGWTNRAWTWHEAADTRVFKPIPDIAKTRDLVWIGNWGDNERAAELEEFFIRPVKTSNLKATVHGVRYPEQARAALKAAGIEFRGWLPNFHVPRAFAGARATVHVPRRPYVQALPGIPTIRTFEAMACGIPLISAFWDDREHLFRPGKDYLLARNGDEMQRHLMEVLKKPGLATELAGHGLETIRSRHTCAHRVDQLLEIYDELKL